MAQHLYLHDRKVRYLGTGPMGTWVIDDEIGEKLCVFSHGKAVYACLGTEPKAEEIPSCPRCSWVYRKELIRLE